MPRIFLCVCILILTLTISTAQTDEEDLSLEERVENLGLDNTDTGEKVFYSKGYLARGNAISQQIEKARIFYLDSLGIEVELSIALLDTADYNKVSPGIPYGLPFVSFENLVFLPADTSLGAVKEMYAPFKETASEAILSSLRKVGFAYEEALRRMVDLIGFHELGHVQNDAYAIDSKQPWFDEFMASYFCYTYLQHNEPTLAIIWNSITRAGFEGHTPRYTSLDDFNELYFGVGVGDYSWFQNAFQERIRAVYPQKGIDFIRLVQKRLSDPAFKPETANELLEVLEEIEPGFVEWANSLKN
ncbi:MAG: hypothetical protein AAGA10_29180 [Bacteroidota bacterium]